MKTLSLKYKDNKDVTSFVLKNYIAKNRNILLQIFTGSNNRKFIENIIFHIKNLIPHINIIGATTSGEILGGDSFNNSTILSFSIFDHTEIEIYSINTSKKDSNTAEKIISQFPKDRSPKVAISFIDGLSINGEEYIKSFYKYDKNLVISGGLAGDNNEFKNTMVFTKDKIMENGAVVALLFSDFLEIITQASFGWENIGKTMTITKSDLNTVYEIDGIKAIDVYAKYLGDDIAKELPKIGVEFPLIVQKDEISMPRAVLGTGENGSLIFAGNLYVGDKVTFGYGDIDSILNYSNHINISNSESIFIYSCMARKTLMKDHIRLELIPLSKITSVSGFFTYGEFYSNRATLNNELLNETMTILSLSEKSCKYTKYKDKDCSYGGYNQGSLKLDNKNNLKEKKDSLTLKAFSHLISQAFLELEEVNSSLEKRVKKEFKENVKKEELLQRQSRLAQMGEMISMIAHQWRQPLGAISSSVIGIKSKISIGKFDFSKEEDREKFFKFLDRKLLNISDYVQTLSETIDDFRNFFKPDKQKEKIALSEPIKRALKIVEMSMKSKGIKIISRFENEDQIFLYQNEMMQVALNILKNSEDNFVEKKIQNPEIEIITYLKSGNYIIQITDNGGGIPEHILPNIFDPYFSTKNDKNGTGIGLYMSKIMIEEHHNGKLSAKNIKGGVSFIIEIAG